MGRLLSGKVPTEWVKVSVEMLASDGEAYALIFILETKTKQNNNKQREKRWAAPLRGQDQ